MFKSRPLPTVSFATTVWENDYRFVLSSSNYLKERQIENHNFSFSEKILLINNVADLDAVRTLANQKLKSDILTHVYLTEELSGEVFSFFNLERTDFRVTEKTDLYPSYNSDWLYYNALGPLTALYVARSDYLLYQTGDVYLNEKLDWIGKAIRRMEELPSCKVANPVWNGKYSEARGEAYKKEWNFYHAKQGFSDQMFLVKVKDFRQPMYGELCTDSVYFPRGNPWEKRAFSGMKIRGWERLIYRRGSYTHENWNVASIPQLEQKRESYGRVL